jgi:hypothetical protein
LNLNKITSYRIFSFFLLLVAFGIYLSGCVNVNQKTTINADGSGAIKLEYWTKMSNLTSSTDLGDFSFEEAKAKTNYTSSNSDVSNVKVADKLDDSTKHVTMDISFKNLNDLPKAKGFEKITSSWKEGKEGMDFKYTLLKDTSAADNMGASDIKLTYEFTFPGEVLSTNGTKTDKTVKWEKSLSDLKNDIDMTASVKKEGKKCGLFGLEMPLVFLLGMIFVRRFTRKK